MEKWKAKSRFPLFHSHDYYDMHSVMGYGFKGQGQFLVEQRLVTNGTERLLKSFSRRLGFLHTSKEAVDLVSRWLAPNGLLGDVGSLNELGAALFRNIAPVAPEMALSAIERTVPVSSESFNAQNCERYVYLLRSLAYDRALFARCVSLLALIAGTGDLQDNARSNHPLEALTSLFTLYLSGTHAPIEDRLVVIKVLFLSGNEKKQRVGLAALRAVLEAWHFSSYHSFDFGAHSRDFGYWPKDQGEVHHWYESALSLVTEFSCQDNQLASDVRDRLASQFRGLWSRIGLHTELCKLSQSIAQGHFWPDGWIAIRQTQHFDSKSSSPESRETLASLERLLRPKGTIQQIQSIVLSSKMRSRFDLDLLDSADNFQKAYERLERTAEDLGRAAAMDDPILEAILPDLEALEGRVVESRLWSFGRGLAKGTSDAPLLWDRIVSRLGPVHIQPVWLELLTGFTYGLNEVNPGCAGALLDKCVADPTLATVFPALQATIGVDRDGVERVMKSLELGIAPIERYRSLCGGRALANAAGADFKRLVLEIAKKSGGFPVAVEILTMRLHSEKNSPQGYSPDVTATGQGLLQNLAFESHNNHEDYELGEIARVCLAGDEGARVASEISNNMRDALARYKTYSFSHRHLIENLMGAQPLATLDGFFGELDEDYSAVHHLLDDIDELRHSPLNKIPLETLLAWCNKKPVVRYPLIAAGITIASAQIPGVGKSWTTTALALLENAPDRIAVMKAFIHQFFPMSWSGSRATIIESNAKLLNEMKCYPDAALVAFITEEETRLQTAIKEERDSETFRDRERDETFE
jgi:hypothetical protein